jgi:hypothetical protein
MALKGWAELVHEGRLKELDQMDASMRKSQVLKWIQEDKLDGIRARATWGRVLNESDSFWDQIEAVVANAVEEEKVAQEKERVEQERKHRYEYEVINIEGNQNAKEIINAYAREGWRLHTFSLTALDAGAFMGGWMKAFGGPGVAFTNVLTLVFERDRRSN